MSLMILILLKANKFVQELIIYLLKLFGIIQLKGQTYNDRYVIYNYGEKTQLPTGVWYTGTNTNSIRTTWIDSIVYPKPYATQFNSSGTGTTPSIVGETGLGQTVYFQHEIGTDQINPRWNHYNFNFFSTVF
jgi:hypothetical protein